jgi:hypothetical protein
MKSKTINDGVERTFVLVLTETVVHLRRNKRRDLGIALISI